MFSPLSDDALSEDGVTLSPLSETDETSAPETSSAKSVSGSSYGGTYSSEDGDDEGEDETTMDSPVVDCENTFAASSSSAKTLPRRQSLPLEFYQKETLEEPRERHLREEVRDSEARQVAVKRAKRIKDRKKIAVREDARMHQRNRGQNWKPRRLKNGRRVKQEI